MQTAVSFSVNSKMLTLMSKHFSNCGIWTKGTLATALVLSKSTKCSCSFKQVVHLSKKRRFVSLNFFADGSAWPTIDLEIVMKKGTCNWTGGPRVLTQMVKTYHDICDEDCFQFRVQALSQEIVFEIKSFQSS